MSSPEPPDLPPFRQRLRLSWLQRIGVPLLILPPVLAFAGVLDASVTEGAFGTASRVAIIYVILSAVFRMLGKRELGALTSFELVMLMLVPEIVSESLTETRQPLSNALVGVLTLFSLMFAVSVLTHRFPKLTRVVDNPPTVLVADGKIIERHMNTERIGADELVSELHKAGLERLDQVRWAILQSDGHIAIIPRFTPTQRTSPI